MVEWEKGDLGEIVDICEADSLADKGADFIVLSTDGEDRLDLLVKYTSGTHTGGFDWISSEGVIKKDTTEVENDMTKDSVYNYDVGMLVHVESDARGGMIDEGAFALISKNDYTDVLPLLLTNRDNKDTWGNWYGLNDVTILNIGNMLTATGEDMTKEEFYSKVIEDVGLELLEMYDHPLAEDIKQFLENKLEVGTLVYVKSNTGGAIIGVGEFALIRFNDNSDWLPISLINRYDDDHENNWFPKEDLVVVNDTNLHTVTGHHLTKKGTYTKLITDVGLELLEEYEHPLAKELEKYLSPTNVVEEVVEVEDKEDFVVNDDTVLSMNTKELVTKVEEWAVARNLHTAEPSKQYLKLVEEVGETVDAIRYGNIPEIVDGLGDVVVVSVIMSLQLGISTDFIVSTIDTLDYLEKTFVVEESDYHRPTKLTVSLGKVAEDLARGRDVQNSLISVFADLVILRHLKVYESLPLRKSLATAYNEIKHRKGKLVDGVFIKEEDLK